jgi:hypothetical protein
MKTSLARLLDPANRTYASLGVCALALSRLMASASAHRIPGAGSGPLETMAGYRGCTGLGGRTNFHWHSRRTDLKTQSAHVQNICDRILEALCSDAHATTDWRRSAGIALSTEMAFRVKGHGLGVHEEGPAFARFMALHGHRLDASLNPQHRNAKVLCFPEFNVNDAGIWLTCSVTTPTELKVSGGCASRWDVSWITGTPHPTWKFNRETFVEFLDRATAHYLAAKLTNRRG